MTRCLMWVCIASLVFAGAASASVKQGDTELDLLGGFTAQNGTAGGPDFDAWFVSSALGYFLTDNIQVQAAVMAALTSTEIGSSDVDVDVWGIGVRGKYHFMPANQWVPYIGGQLLWVTADVDGVNKIASGLGFDGLGIDGNSDGTLWGPLAGLRYELSANNDFYVEYQFQIWEGDLDRLWNDGHTILLGIIHQFK